VAAAAATIATLTAGITTALAVDPPPSPEIHACVAKAIGSVRIVASPTACRSLLERPVTWDQHGSPGPTGPPGADGANGVDGAQGPQGVVGERGPAGGVNPPTIVKAVGFSVENGIPTAGAVAYCPEGMYVSGGGVSVQHPMLSAAVSVMLNQPYTPPGAPEDIASAWRGFATASWAEVAAHNNYPILDFRFNITVWAICV
jgi:hypothetical protein